MLKYASVEIRNTKVIQEPRSTKVASKTAGIKLSNGTTYTPPSDALVVSTRAISARVNQNFDGFPSQELKKAYRSFIGRPVFVNHNNEDHRRTRGIIVDSQYKEAGTDKYIELLIEVDAKNFPRLAKLISTGELDSVSMGTDVKRTICSYCGNQAEEVKDFCDHVRNNKGQRLSRLNKNGERESVLVYESCVGLNFFEISFVFDPADETAVAKKIYLPKKSSRTSSRNGDMYPSVPRMQKRALGEVTSPEAVDTLRDQTNCPICDDESFDPEDSNGCDVCGYVQPPEEMQDPDTMKSRVLQIVRHQQANTTQGKEGKHNMANRLQENLAKKRLLEAQRRLADGADMTTDEARDSDQTNPTEIDQQWTSQEEASTPDDKTNVTKLPTDYKSSSREVAQNRAAYLKRKAGFGDDPSQDPSAPADPQSAAPSDSDGPNSGPPSSSDPGTSGIDGLPIDWKQDESGQPYGTVQGTDLDIFVNEDMTWQVLPEGSNDPVAQGQGSDYNDCVQQAFQQAESLGSQSQDPSQDPSADPSSAPAAGGDPSAPPAGAAAPDPTKTSRRKRADTAGADVPVDLSADERTDVEKLPNYETIEDGGKTYDARAYEEQGSGGLPGPVDGSDVQNFAPGGKPFTQNNKSAARKTSAVKAMELAQLYIDLNVIPNTRTALFKAVGELEQVPAAIVNDRIAQLSMVEKAKAVSAPRNSVPQRAAASRLPSMGRAASFNSSVSESAGNDYVALLS